MARSARRHEVDDPWSTPLRSGAAGAIRLVARNPAAVGGATAFLVALSFVSANALWYQPHAHSGAFFATRDFAGPLSFTSEPETTIRIERPAAAVKPKGDPDTKQVQEILKELNFYAGDVDGIAGPNTRKAIEVYQSKMGLTVTGMVDAELLDQLGADSATAAILPSFAPRESAAAAADEAVALPVPRPEAAMTASPPQPDEKIKKIQAGLKAFGNEGIEIDGLLGARTKSAIHEFQALFGLPETSQPDAAVYAKMQEIGLTN